MRKKAKSKPGRWAQHHQPVTPEQTIEAVVKLLKKKFVGAGPLDEKEIFKAIREDWREHLL